MRGQPCWDTDPEDGGAQRGWSESLCLGLEPSRTQESEAVVGMKAPRCFQALRGGSKTSLWEGEITTIIGEAHYTTQPHAWQLPAPSSEFQHKNVQHAAKLRMGGIPRWQGDLKYEHGCEGDLLWLRLPKRAPESYVALWPPAPVSQRRCSHCPAGDGKGSVEKHWQMRASKVLQNSMFSFLSNFNLSLTSLRSFPAALAPLRARPALRQPGAGRCFWWYSPRSSSISIPCCCSNTSPWKYLGRGLANAKANTRTHDAGAARCICWEHGRHILWGS